MLANGMARTQPPDEHQRSGPLRCTLEQACWPHAHFGVWEMVQLFKYKSPNQKQCSYTAGHWYLLLALVLRWASSHADSWQLPLEASCSGVLGLTVTL